MVFYSMIEYHKKSCVTRDYHIVIKYDNKYDNIIAHNVKLAIILDGIGKYKRNHVLLLLIFYALDRFAVESYFCTTKLYSEES